MLELKNIKKSYKTGDSVQIVLNNIQLNFKDHEFVAILGPSGCGKTTLLNIISGLDQYDEGELIINHKTTKNFKSKDWDTYRNNCIGFIFQNYNLIEHLNILTNVEMSLTLSGVSLKKRRKMAKAMLEKVGLKNHIYKRPNELSGGQIQRVAIARALVNDPKIILADEPTGALDTNSSFQIMELIKSISKNKLVIMVTHNEKLASTYADRIIKMCDGKIIKDSNPADPSKTSQVEYKRKKTAMSFLSALYISLNNIRTKKGRTILTSFASSIGIIGIALILSIANGFNKQMKIFEQSTMSTMPIVIEEQWIATNNPLLNQTSKEKEYPNSNHVYPEKQQEIFTYQNYISKDFLSYIENINPLYVSGLAYYYLTELHLVNKINGEIKVIENMVLENLPKSLNEKEQDFLKEKYDILAGEEPTKKEDLVLVVDNKNHVPETILKNLGLDSTKAEISFDEIIGTTLKLALNDSYYKKVGDYYGINTDLNSVYNDEKNLALKVVGIIRLKENYRDYIDTTNFYYTNELLNYIKNQNKNSKIVKDQKKQEYNVLTGEFYDLSSELGQWQKKQTLEALGDEGTPYKIQVYPTDFNSKKEIIRYIDTYNEEKEKQEKILYTDEAKTLSSTLEQIMDTITIILTSFSTISLFVSSLMVGIILYISVLERKKEIGILRSLGARKKDIARVFKSEAFLIGLASGILGILMTKLLLIPINSILYHLSKIKNLALINPWHALFLILISIGLTLLGGMIPAKLASKKDPVEALRCE